jgi:conjugative relaxase-like TrwC/TraI family protein
VLRFTTFGSAAAAVRYFVRDGADCATPGRELLAPAVDVSTAGRAVDYYSEGERALGVWAGSGAGALGLTGVITAGDRDVVMRLLSGRLPDGQQVARPVRRPHPDGRLPIAPLVDAVRDTAAARGLRVDQLLDGDGLRGSFARLSGRADRDPTAVAHPQQLTELAAAAGIDMNAVYGPGVVAVAFAQAEVKVDVRRAGIDGPVSAPKSVSVLWALADSRTQAEVLAAHRTAVTEAVAYLERWAGHGLRGHQGDGQRAARVGTDGLIVAAFEHLTSRADDPQIHTHLVVANLLHGDDDKWSALDTRAFFRAQRTAGYLYQAVLRGQLTERLGVGWGPVRKGVAEIDGIPAGLRREFSTRRRAIEAELAADGAGGVKAAQVACLQTRPAKSGRAVGELLAGWWSRARQQVPDPVAAVRAVLHRSGPPMLDVLEQARIGEALLDADGLTAHDTGFDRGDATRGLLEHLPAGATVDHAGVERLVDDLLADERVLPLIPDVHGARRYTTRDLATRELSAIRTADGATTIPATGYPVVDVDGVSAEQLTALIAVVASTARVDVILGSAGAGKTAMLTVLHDHYGVTGVPVVGACVAAIAARRLEQATAIPATSVARLAGRIRDGHSLPDQCVVVLDEAGMVGTRHYATLLTEVARVGGKLVAVGDRAQLTEIDAGGLFAHMCRRYRRAELTDNHRQAQPWERDALTALRSGNVPGAWRAYRDHNRLHHHPDHDTLRLHIAGQYLAALAAGTPPLQLVALSGSRDVADQLNTDIRHALQQGGHLGPDHDIGGRPLAVGELVLVTRNDHQRGLLNGTRGTVTTITDRHVTLHLDDARAVTVPAAWAAERLQPAYAMTVHKAQGLTVDIALVDTTCIGDRNTGYVAFSRARARTDIHHTGSRELLPSLGDDPLTGPFPDERQRGGAWQRLVEQRQQRLAVDQATWWQPAAVTHHDPYEHDYYRYDQDRGYGRGM